MSRKSGEELLSMVESWVVSSGQSAAILAFFTAYRALLERANPRAVRGEMIYPNPDEPTATNGRD